MKQRGSLAAVSVHGKGLTFSFLARLDIYIFVIICCLVLSQVPWGKYCILDGSHVCDKEVLENVCEEMYERT